jgi:phage/plasmid primase-like uncharacterized protein
LSFTLFARAHGVEIADLYPSEQIRRCATTENPRKKNGAYFWDGARGWAFAWDGEARTQWYEDPNARPWTDAEKQAWANRQQAAKAERERRYELTARGCAMALKSAHLAPHNYLAYKGFKDECGLVDADGAMLIPMISITGRLQGLQVIRWLEDERRYEKKMVPGMRAKGAVFRIGAPHAHGTVLVEGYATGLSVAAAQRSTGAPASVLVCFSDSNMVHVAPLVPGPNTIYADNDVSGAGERAAKETGLPYCMSDTVGHDANDDHQASGLMSVAFKLMQLRRSTLEAKQA